MSTVTKTFTFDSNAEGWVVSGGTSDTTLQYSSTGGNTGGCLSSRIFGRNKSADPHWYYAGTWEDMGVPAGATVTHIQLLGFDWRCSEWNVGGTTTQIRAAQLYDSAGTTLITALSTSEPTVSGTTSYASISGTQQAVGASYQASNTEVQLWSDLYLRNANNASAAVTLLMDNFSVEITYTEAANIVVTPAAGALTLTGYAPTVTVTDHKNIVTATGELVLAGIAPTVSVTQHVNVITATGEMIVTGYAPSIGISGETKYLVTKTGYYVTYNNMLITIDSDIAGDIKMLQEGSDGKYTELELTSTTTPPTFE